MGWLGSMCFTATDDFTPWLGAVELRAERDTFANHVLAREELPVELNGVVEDGVRAEHIG